MSKDQYVVIDTNELDKLRPKREKDIAIAAVIKPDQCLRFAHLL